jgi:hypothetical protein
MGTLEGLWTVEFEVAGGWQNGGVLVFETGRLFGGDSNYYYLGTFGVAGEVITAELTSTHYQGPVGDAWGDAATELKVHAQARREGSGRIIGTMTRSGDSRQLRFRLTKRSDLP